jgi:hypothetical protein
VPVPVVVVEVAPPAAEAAAAVLVDTCSTAVRRGRCELGREGAAEPTPAAIAIVSWVGQEHRHVRIQVGVRREADAHWATRDVYFQPSDPELERWRSAGLTIAILIGELPETRALLAEPEPAEPSTPAKPPDETVKSAAPAPALVAPTVAGSSSKRPAAESSPPVAAARAPERAGPVPPSGFVSAFLTVGTGLDSGPVRRGGGLWAAHSLSPLPLWIPVSVTYTWRPREASLKVDFLTLRAGVGHVWALAERRVELEGEAFVALEQLTATATNSTTGQQDSEQRWAPLVGVGAGPIFTLLPPLCVAIEARLGKSLRTFTVYDAGNVVARSAPWVLALEVGPLLTFQ